MKNLVKFISFALLFLTIQKSSVAQVMDIDKTVYKTVQINDQTWMAENLNVTHFSNGDVIPEAKTPEEWIDASNHDNPAWCYYNNDPLNGKTYGKLYNQYAVNDKRGLAPAGWHLPGEKEWAKLIQNMGGQSLAGLKMKSNTGWKSVPDDTYPKTFEALPGGYRYDFGKAVFENIGKFGNWWSTEKTEEGEGLIHSLAGTNNILVLTTDSRGAGMSVRCIKN